MERQENFSISSLTNYVTQTTIENDETLAKGIELLFKIAESEKICGNIV